MVAAVVRGQYLGWMIRIAHCLVEVDHAIKLTTASDPGVHFLTDFLVLRTVKAIKRRRPEDRMLERRDGRSDGFDSPFVCPGDELAITGYHVLGSDPLGGRYERAREQDVVHAEG